jgi:hypothetical protein
MTKENLSKIQNITSDIFKVIEVKSINEELSAGERGYKLKTKSGFTVDVYEREKVSLDGELQGSTVMVEVCSIDLLDENNQLPERVVNERAMIEELIYANYNIY